MLQRQQTQKEEEPQEQEEDDLQADPKLTKDQQQQSMGYHTAAMKVLDQINQIDQVKKQGAKKPAWNKKQQELEDKNKLEISGRDINLQGQKLPGVFK